MSKSTVKTDCFAYGKNECSALKELFCKNSKCRFYKTHIQLKTQLKTCANRLNKIGRDDDADAIRVTIRHI